MKNWKRLLALSLSGAMLAGALTACGGGSSKATPAPAESAAPSESAAAAGDVGDPVNLVFSIAAVPTDAHGAAQKVFKETLEKISGGNMTVECYDSGTLYGQDTEHDALKNGDVDMIYSSASWLTDGSPWVSMFTAGYVFQSYDHMTKVLNGDIGKEVFQKIADEQGILPLGAYYLGTRQISLSEDRQIKTPDDLKGVNLRMPNSDAWVFLGKAMGANPTAIAFNDLYLALQTGTVDGQDNPLPTVKSAKFYEVQKSISLTNHLVDSVWPTINLNTWNKLTDTQKGWVMEAVEAGRKACDEQNLKTESEVQDFLKKQGLKIYDADVTAFADHVLNAYLNDPISDSWDKDLLTQIQGMA
ncbi:MAG: sialic acid TRAP transporter substrate-binding protein SiaP [Pseudoflavonifractor sp.]|nr:sialic acid TRAP transporter substrate-binding protein SiaP [Pseudoflavonifractor sp.]